MGAVPFSPAFLLSEELTNAFIDLKLDLAWDFDYDAVIILNLNDVKFIDYLVKRGQKRFILVGGELDIDLCKSVENSGGTLYKIKVTNSFLARRSPTFMGRLFHRFAIFDLGHDRSRREIKK